MTRGIIIFIDKNQIMHSSCEFNGDMYPEGRGDQIIESFQNGYFKSVSNYEKYVERFNRRNFGYENIFDNAQEMTDNELNIDNNYTDYLYIINGADKGFILVAQSEKYIVPINGMAIVYFDKVKDVLTIEPERKKNEALPTTDEMISHITEWNKGSGTRDINRIEPIIENQSLLCFGKEVSYE